MKSWTYSSLDKFLTCPKQYYHLRVAKDYVDPPSEHTIWGEKVHAALEDYVKDGKDLPDEMSKWQGIVDKLCKLPGEKFTEQKMSIDRNFQPCDWDKAWTRGIIDLLVVNKKTALVADYKTGKRKPSDQLWLYALYVFAHYPSVESVHTVFVWLGTRKIDKETVHRRDIAQAWQRFLPAVNRLEISYEKDSWPAKPSGLCRQWCPVLSCTHNGRKNQK